MVTTTKGDTGRATLLTEPSDLRTAAQDLRQQAGRLDVARTAIAQQLTPEAFAGKWEGLIAEGFLRHENGHYRQHHLDVAHDRLSRLSKVLIRAADANEAEIAKNRRLAAEVRAELAKQAEQGQTGDRAGTVSLPTSLRDTRWPEVHRRVVGGRR